MWDWGCRGLFVGPAGCEPSVVSRPCAGLKQVWEGEGRGPPERKRVPVLSWVLGSKRSRMTVFRQQSMKYVSCTKYIGAKWRFIANHVFNVF